jgi:uncharacterized protein YbcC (UPF0753/DUF2309 family)
MPSSLCSWSDGVPWAEECNADSCQIFEWLCRESDINKHMFHNEWVFISSSTQQRMSSIETQAPAAQTDSEETAQKGVAG